MLNKIDSIVRHVKKELIIRYFDVNKIDYRNVEWDTSKNLLKLEIKRVLENTDASKCDDVMSDFNRINRMAKDDGIEMLSEFVQDLDTTYFPNVYEKAFWCFLTQKKDFEEAERLVLKTKAQKIFAQSFLKHGMFLSGLFYFIFLISTLIQVIGGNMNIKHIWFNIAYFSLGALTTYFWIKGE
jgi:hypothetical protein